MITRVLGCIYFFSFVSHSFSQNLVPNPSFEEYYSCPGSYNYGVDGKVAPGWYSANRGTPDLFNSCSKGDAGVPTNWAGHSKAYSGVGYAGIYCYTKTGYREYLQTELSLPLVQGGKYYIEFYYKLSSNSKFSIDRIGFFFVRFCQKKKRRFCSLFKTNVRIGFGCCLYPNYRSMG